jgi:hypothetical protein
MSKEQQPQEEPRHPAAHAARVFKFGAPKELPAQFGATFVSDQEIQGVIPTERLRALIDAFGLADKRDISIPFHHMRKAHGEIWSMRIESLAGHNVDGVPVMGHQWIYRQELPERMGSAA